GPGTAGCRDCPGSGLSPGRGHQSRRAGRNTRAASARPRQGRKAAGVNRTRLAAVAAVTFTSVLWGTTGTAATFAPAAGPLAIRAAALGIGGLLQAVIALPALRRAIPALRRHLGLLAVGALAVLVYPLAFYSSMDLAGVAVGSVVSLASGPLASGVLERFLDHRVLGPRWSVAAALGIAGSVLLSLATT